MPIAFRSELSARFFSAVLLGPTSIFIAWIGGIWFVGLVTILAAIMYWEWIVMTVRAVDIRRDVLLFLSAVILVLSAFFGYGIGALILSVMMIGLGAFVRMALNMKWGLALCGAGVASMFATSLVHVREGEGGSFYLLVLLCFTVWAADIFAYAAGRTFGGPKLMPSVSPNKTWSGFLGGMAAALIVSGLINYMLVGWSLPTIIILTVCVVVVAQAGDLIESRVKRQFNRKDSSNLLPGHGGVLDRVDGLTLAAAFFVFATAITGLK